MIVLNLPPFSFFKKPRTCYRHGVEFIGTQKLQHELKAFSFYLTIRIFCVMRSSSALMRSR